MRQRGNVARIAATSEIASLPALKGGRSVTTCACSACLSGESPKSCTRRTPESPRILVSMAADLLEIRGRERAALASGDQRRDPVLRVLERLRQVLGLHRR